MVDVQLTPDELERALTVAAQRHCEAIAHKRTGLRGQDPADSLLHHAVGAGGECATHKLYGIPWRPTIHPQRGAPDMGRYEIKTTTGVHLFTAAHVDPGALFVAVRTAYPGCEDYSVRGWCTGADVLRYSTFRSVHGREAIRWTWHGHMRPPATIELSVLETGRNVNKTKGE